MSNVLPYSSGAYQSFYAGQCISSFTHGPLAKGECDLDQAKQIVKCLNEKNAISSISFNPEMLTQQQLKGGACSAIIFRLVKEILPAIKENQDLSLMFLIKIQALIKDLEENAIGSKTMNKAVQKAIRTEQLALNTITVDRGKSYCHHAVAEKVGAMASLYGLKVINSSPEIQVKGNLYLQEELKDTLNSLKNGAYFIRIIQKGNNHKLEIQGHSILYLKLEGSEYYFDPALGGYLLLQGAHKTDLVFNAALSANDQYGVDCLTIHQIEEKEPVLSKRFAFLELGMSGVTYSTEENSPVIIFSPALGNGIQSYKLLALELVKKGFTVMCVDHLNKGSGTPKLQDDEIIKRSLENGRNIAKLAERMNHSIFVMGHSSGGSASVEACLHSSKIKAVINLDGRIIDPSNVEKPVLQVIAKNVKEDRTVYNDALKSLHKCTQIELDVKHGDFSSSDPKLIENLAELCANFLGDKL